VTQSSTTVVQPDQNILQFAADFILNKFSGNNYSVQAPDFSKLFVLLPHAQVIQPFNEALCRSLGPNLPAIASSGSQEGGAIMSRDGRYVARSQEGGAIIPPWADTLKAWTKHFVCIQQPDKNDGWQIISEQTRQLLFIEALQQHPDLFKEENQWQVTQALLSLFDELSLNQQDIFSSPEQLQHQLQQAYGIEDQHDHLLYESKLVYTLWHAWQKQLSENQLYDETADYLSRLKNAPTVINKQQHFICLGLSQYTKTEQDFIQYLVNNKQCHVIEFSSTIRSEMANHVTTEATTNIKTSSTFAAFISETFTQSTQSIKQRALDFATQYPETTPGNLPFSTYLASNEEEQIRAIEYYVRLSVLNGKNNVAIISEDRKLSRRLRAVLERANIQLQDKAGWSLATTQAATIIERWLECIEEDFSAYALLDCLKSPFFNITAVEAESADNAFIRNNFKKNIYRFEQDLIFHENVSSNIEQYKAKLKQRIARLSHWPESTYDELINTLNFIQKTAAPLTNFYTSEKNAALSDFLDALYNSLQQLGVLQGYQNDNAGLVLLKTFATLKQSISCSNPTLSWYDFRIWLSMALESQHFTPPTNDSRVQLMTLEQASFVNFDCLVIAATESQHYPGSAKNQPFFNQAVRTSLGLETWDRQREQRHELFNRALLSAPDILLTACNEENGEEKPVSPWLELLINFYQLAYNRKPDNTQLQQLVLSNSEVFNSDTAELPEQASNPVTIIPEDLIPEKVSASAYQRIINCPYQYFSADGLRLKPLEEISEELKKSDYGERIHLILQCFHHGHKKFGKAFSHAITQANAKQAEQYLSKLSERIFLADLENNILHRSWLYRWQKHIPAYINWQIKQQLDWSIYLSEKNLEVTLGETVKIVGRLDRIDKNKENNTHAIIDYKTGKTARQEDIDTGENVQLSIYALLDHGASEVSYLSLDSSYQKVESKASLSGEDLEINREQNKQRLIQLFKQMKNREAMPAWGDVTVCRYCNFSGLCRKAEWGE
jgi:ATP-dependent helicase/nuclease subunit B